MSSNRYIVGIAGLEAEVKRLRKLADPHLYESYERLQVASKLKEREMWAREDILREKYQKSKKMLKTERRRTDLRLRSAAMTSGRSAFERDSKCISSEWDMLIYEAKTCIRAVDVEKDAYMKMLDDTDTYEADVAAAVRDSSQRQVTRREEIVRFAYDMIGKYDMSQRDLCALRIEMDSKTSTYKAEKNRMEKEIEGLKEKLAMAALSQTTLEEKFQNEVKSLRAEATQSDTARVEAERTLKSEVAHLKDRVADLKACATATEEMKSEITTLKDSVIATATKKKKKKTKKKRKRREHRRRKS
eukprot:g905.t1